MKRRVAIYVRVSTSEQSTDLQLRELNDFVNSRGWEITSVYEDSAFSGTTANRPQLKQLMSDVRQRKIDIVVCWKLDRLFRSLKDLIQTLQDFADVGVEFISLKDQLDLSTSSGRLLMHMIGAFAEFEAALIRERVCAGLANAKKKGVRLGRPRNVRRNDEKIVLLRQSGLSLKAIGKELGVSKGLVSAVLHRIREVSKPQQNASKNGNKFKGESDKTN